MDIVRFRKLENKGKMSNPSAIFACGLKYFGLCGIRKKNPANGNESGAAAGFAGGSFFENDLSFLEIGGIILCEILKQKVDIP